MDFRQDAAHRRRAQDAAARPPLRPCRRLAEACELGGGFRRGRWQGQGDIGVPDRRNHRRSGDGRGNVRAEGAVRPARLAQHRLSPGWFEAPSEIRPRVLRLQFDDRGSRPGRRDPRHRFESAPRSGGAQRAHSQALARGRRADRARRRNGRPHLQIQLPRRRAGIARRLRRPSAGERSRSRCSFLEPAPSRGPMAAPFSRSRRRRRCRLAS